MEGKSESGFTFVNEKLDRFLNNLASTFSVSSKEPRACALTHPGAYSESVRKQHAYSTSVTREFEGPKSISCFDYEIKLQPLKCQSPVVNSVKTKFAQEPCGLKNIQVLTNLRFPAKLKTCYVKNFDFEKDALEQERTKKPKTRRKPRRARFSLSENVTVNDDNYHLRSNLLPTDEDLRSAYDKVFPCRAIPYIFGCVEKSDVRHNCAVQCAEKVGGFRLFVEVPQDGRRLPPIVAENLKKIRNDSDVVDDVSAMLAVSAVRTATPSTSRMFVPLSQDLADKIEVLSEVFEVDEEPTVEDPEVCRVVENIVEFVDKQSEFPEADFDPDISLDDSSNTFDSKDDVSQNDVCPSDDSSSASPTKILLNRKKKRNSEKNKVVRELKKLLNISVKDDDEGDSNVKEAVCEEPTCVLGCVCSSLNDKPPPVDHCGQAECIFSCSCTEKKYFYVSEGDLAKEEKSWHQTVVRKKGNAVELKSGFERSKRQSKLPSKYVDAFTGQHFDHIVRTRKSARDKEKLTEECEAEMDKFINSNRSSRRRRGIDEMKPDNSRSYVEAPINDPDDAYAPKIRWKEDTNRKRSESLKKKCDDIKKDMMASRLAVSGTGQVKTLDQLFIWCSVHDKYDCHCSNYVVMTRNSNLLLKAPRTNRYTAKRLMSQTSLKIKKNPENRIVKLWDDEKHCARSVGAVMNYSARNKTGVYKRIMKRVLVEAKVSSFSNGFVKTKPVATITPESDEELLSNRPLSDLPCYGIGTVTHLSTGKNLVVAETMELSDDEKDSSKATSNVVNESSEIVPKPKKRSSESFQPCFSLYSKNVSKKPKIQSTSAYPPCTDIDSPTPDPPLIDFNTPVQIDAESADSDVEFIEEPMEVLSIKSSDDDEPDDQPKVADSSESRSSTAPKSQAGSTPRNPVKVSSPITIVSDDDDDNAGSPSGESSTSEPELSLPVTAKTQQNSVPEKPQDPVDEDYPMFGLCNLKHKEFGYVPLLDATGTKLQIEIPGTNHSRTFEDAKDARNFMMTMVEKFFVVSRDGQFGDWNKVTKGVLKALKVKKFPNLEFSPSAKITSATNSPPQPQAATPNKNKPIVTIGNTKQLKRPFPLARAQKEDTKSSTPHKSPKNSETVQGKASSPKQAEASASSSDDSQSSVPEAPSNLQPLRSTIVGTFPSMSEAHSFLEKNFPARVPVQSHQMVRASQPSVAYTTLKSISSPAVVSPGNTPSALRPYPMILPRVPGAKQPTARNLVRIANGNVISLVGTPTHILGPNGEVKTVTKITALDPSPVAKTAATGVKAPAQSLTGQVPVKIARATLTTRPRLPGGHPVVLSSAGTITVSAPSSTAGISTLVCPVSQPVRQKALRRADVIVPRDTDFATVISPSPTSKQQTDAKLVYSGVVITKPDAPKPEPAKAVICDKNSTAKSLLPQKSSPASADPTVST